MIVLTDIFVIAIFFLNKSTSLVFRKLRPVFCKFAYIYRAARPTMVNVSKRFNTLDIVQYRNHCGNPLLCPDGMIDA